MGGGSGYHFSKLGMVDSIMQDRRPFMNETQIKELNGDNQINLKVKDSAFPFKFSFEPTNIHDYDCKKY